MSIPKFTVDVNAHQNLADQPALNSTQLKQAWDKPANDIKDYINNTLVDAIDDAIETITGSIDTAITTKLQAIYPVGRVIYSESSINPATIFGFGTWELTGQGQFIVGYDSTNEKFNAGGKTGGSLTKMLNKNEIPTLTLDDQVVKDISVSTLNKADLTFTGTVVTAVSKTRGQAKITNNNQQALDITPTYRTMYMYKRVS